MLQSLRIKLLQVILLSRLTLVSISLERLGLGIDPHCFLSCLKEDSGFCCKTCQGQNCGDITKFMGHCLIYFITVNECETSRFIQLGPC